MLEMFFYLGSLFESSRLWFAAVDGRKRKAAILWISALLPYLIFAVAAGTITRNGFYLLAVLSGIFAFWHAVTPRRLAYDAGFLVIAAAPLIAKVFPRIYLSPDDHLKVGILGQLMWIRLGLIALLVLREWDPGPLSLWPGRREWLTGSIWFAIIIVPVSIAAIGLRGYRYLPLPYPWWKTAGIAVVTFLGFFWVVSLGEEIYFRGFVQRGLSKAGLSPPLAILASALIYGSVHLWFRHFPDWPQAATAAILGIGCGMAYQQTGTVRASMVTHALTIVCWRILFK